MAEGSLASHGYAARFSARLGRAGFDGVAPLDLTLSGAGSTLSARGALAAEGGFEGRMEAGGSDLAALMPAPAGPWRATGRLTAAADLIAADDLAFDLGGQPARGAATPLSPDARLDIALAAGRLDLDAWVAALPPSRGYALPQRGAGQHRPVGPIDRVRRPAAAPAARRPLPGRRAALPVRPLGRAAGRDHHRGRRRRRPGRAWSSPSVSPRRPCGRRWPRSACRWLAPTRPGCAAPRAASSWRWKAARPRSPTWPRRWTGRSWPATASGGPGIDDRGGNRGCAAQPVGLGLTIDRLDLNGLLPPLPDAAGLNARLAGFDLNLRLAADKVAWRELTAERATLDAALENGRVTLRRLALRTGELDAAASGALQLGAPLRISDASLEFTGAGAALLPLLPAEWAGLAPLLAPAAGAPPVRQRCERGAGAARGRAISARSAPRRRRRWTRFQSRGSGTLTLRHPGAPRLLAPLLGPEAVAWLGPGSFSVIASLSGQGLFSPARMVTAEHLDLVAGSFRGRGQMTLALDGARPRLTGRFAADVLPLPFLPLRGTVAACGWTGSARSMPSWRWRRPGWNRPAPWCWTPPARH